MYFNFNISQLRRKGSQNDVQDYIIFGICDLATILEPALIACLCLHVPEPVPVPVPARLCLNLLALSHSATPCPCCYSDFVSELVPVCELG